MKNGYRDKVVPKIRTLDTLHVRYKLYEHAYNKINIIHILLFSLFFSKEAPNFEKSTSFHTLKSVQEQKYSEQHNFTVLKVFQHKNRQIVTFTY